MLNERKLTERELDKRAEAIQGLLSNKRTLVKKYGKDAEKVMYGIATKQAKNKVEDMNKDKLKELIQSALQKEDTSTIDTGFSGRADYGEEDKALGQEDELEMKGLEEALNPEVSQAVSRFIKAMAKRYNYSEQDAVFAIMAALKQRKFDGLNEELNDMDEGLKDLFRKSPKPKTKEQELGTYKQQVLNMLKGALKDDNIKSPNLGDWVDDRIMDLYGKNNFPPTIDGQRMSSSDFYKSEVILNKMEQAENTNNESLISSLKEEFYNLMKKAIIDFEEPLDERISKIDAIIDSADEIEVDIDDYDMNEAIAEDNSYVRVSEPKYIFDKRNPNFLYVNFKYDIGPGGSSIALGKETMTGQIRRLSSAEAMKQATALAKNLERKYNIEDIDIYDKDNGVVQIFAVSDDFINMGSPSIDEEVTKPEEKKLKKIKKELEGASKMHAGQAKKIAKIVKEKLTKKSSVEDHIDADLNENLPPKELKSYDMSKHTHSKSKQSLPSKPKIIDLSKQGKKIQMAVASYLSKQDKKKVDEGFKVGDKVTYLGHPAEITKANKDVMDRISYSVSYDKGNGKTKASNIFNKDGEIKASK